MPTDLHDKVIRRLEDAGRTLQILPMPGLPGGAKAAWPDVLQEHWDVMGKADKGTIEERVLALAMTKNATRLGVSTADITRLDEVLGWILKIPKPHWRKAVFARMMTHPISERPLYSWVQIAKNLGTNRHTVRHWYDAGVQAILEELS